MIGRPSPSQYANPPLRAIRVHVHVNVHGNHIAVLEGSASPFNSGHAGFPVFPCDYRAALCGPAYLENDRSRVNE